MRRTLVQQLRRGLSRLDINRHRGMVKLYRFDPQMQQSVFVHPSATLCGEVYLANYAEVWQNSVLRGDLNAVRIDHDTVVLENCSLSTAHAILNSGEVADLYIGPETVVMPGCTLVSCQVESNCFIGAGSVICEGAKLESGCIIGPGSVVPPNRYIPAGQVWAGNPVRFVKFVDKPDRVAIMDYRSELQSRPIIYRGEFTCHNGAYLEQEALAERELGEDATPVIERQFKVE